MSSKEEQELIDLARETQSEAEWIVGRCAALWTQKYARGRTDADFAVLVGQTTDQIYSKRRVWETFADVKTQYPNLKWSHFYVSLTWQDSAECLQWAEENQATVAEMKAWRRLQHGEDLTVDADENCSESESGSESVVGRTILSVSGAADTAAATDKIVRPTGDGEGMSFRNVPETHDDADLLRPTSAALSDTERPYSPYRSGSSAAPREDNGDGPTRDAVLTRKTCIAVSHAIKKTDDTRQFVTELLATCWREAQGDTADAIKEFSKDKPLCR